MSRIKYPEKYQVLWCDQHIAKGTFCQTLREAFFHQTDPGQENPTDLSKENISHLIQQETEDSPVFEGCNIVFRAFRDENSCFQYIVENQDKRIILIISNSFGRLIVPKILTKYPQTFTNPHTNEPYSSIYIFCLDTSSAGEWAIDFVDYIKIFDFEKTLLEKLLLDLSEEFTAQAKTLLESNENDMAIERLNWSKTLLERHEKVRFRWKESQQKEDKDCQAYRKGTNRELNKRFKMIEDMIKDIESRRHEGAQNSDSEVIANHSFLSANHSIVYVCFILQDTYCDEHTVAIEEKQLDNGEIIICIKKIELYQPITKSLKNDSPTNRHFIEKLTVSRSVDMNYLENEFRSTFIGSSDRLNVFHDFQSFQLYFENQNDEVLFIVGSGSFKHSLHNYFSKALKTVEQIYIHDELCSNITRLVISRNNKVINFLVFPDYKILLTDLLKNFHKYCSSEFSYFKDQTVLSNTSPQEFMMDYVGNSLNHLKKLDANKYREAVEETTIFLKEAELLNTKQDLQEEVSQNMTLCYVSNAPNQAVIYLVDLPHCTIEIDPNLALIQRYGSRAELFDTLAKKKATNPFLLISSTSGTSQEKSFDNGPFFHQIQLISQNEHQTVKLESSQKISRVASIDKVVPIIYHQLGIYYRDAAMSMFNTDANEKLAEQLLTKSTNAYKLMQLEFEKRVKKK